MAEPDLRWTAALEALGANRGDAGAVFERLADRHAEPSRRYHTFDHASAVVDTVLSLHVDGDPWAPTVVAAWFHDAVYDAAAARGVNEGASAVLAVEMLSSLGATLAGIGEVSRLVCLTAGHDPRVGDRAGCLLTDADLAILAAPNDRYDEYVAAVRAEYEHVPDEQWRSGRGQVLRSLLGRPSLYRTPEGVRRWEQSARSNLSQELEQLGRR